MRSTLIPDALGLALALVSPCFAQAPATAPAPGAVPTSLPVAGPPAEDHTAGVLPAVRVDQQKAAPSASSLLLGSSATSLDTPFSISRVAAAQLREQAVTTLQEALRNVPGVQADSGFNGSHTQFFILRGAVSDSGTGSNRVFRDGVRLSNYPYAPAFVESVDVLRGPGAVAGVRSEPGGTVSLRTRQPELRDFGSVLISAGSDRAQEVSLDLNRVLSAEQELAVRATATRSNASEWRHVPDRLDGIKLGVAKSDGPRYHLRAGVEATNQTYRPDYGLPSLDGRPVNVPADRQLSEPFGDSTVRNRIVDIHADVGVMDTSRWSLDLVHLEADSTSIKNVIGGSPLVNQPAGTWARSSSWEPGTTRRIDSAATTLTGTAAAAGLRHEWTMALDYYTEKLYQPTLSLPAASSPPINAYAPVYGGVRGPAEGATLPRSLTTQDLRATGATVQDAIDLGPWRLVAGLRYDRQDFLYGAAGTQAVRESRLSPKLAVMRELGEDDRVYVNASSGTSPNQVASSTNQSLPSRHSRQIEAGWKSQWAQRQVTSELAVYQLDQSNMISSDLSTPANNFDFNVAGEARSRGAEFSLDGRWSDRLRGSLAYAYTDAVYRYNAVYGGKRVPNVARHVVNLWGQYAWNERWRSGVGVYVQGRRFADEANTTVLPGYARIDLSQTWTMPLGGAQAIEWQLALRNAFDRRYYVSSHLHVARWVTPGPERSWVLTGTYRF